MKIDSSQYIGPAIAYIQELVNLASEKGFIMSRISARELSNKLSNTINNDIMEPILRVSNVSVFDRSSNYRFIDISSFVILPVSSRIQMGDQTSTMCESNTLYSQ